MSKERYDICVALLLTLSIISLGVQFFFPPAALLAMISCILAIAMTSLQMRAKPQSTNARLFTLR